MKKFSQIDETEQTSDHDHFVHHAKKWEQHTSTAAQLDDRGYSRADWHYNKADEHEQHIEKRHGPRAVEHLHRNVNAANASKEFKTHHKSWSSINEAMTPMQRKIMDAKFAVMTHTTGISSEKYRPPGEDHGKKSAHQIVSHKGKEYWHTGKTGTHIKSGEPSYEYSHRGEGGESRLWMRKSGKVDED